MDSISGSKGMAHAEVQHGCFERHIREAIALNMERMPRYAALTDGASLPVSRHLISRERLLLLPAGIFDRIAMRYQRRGIPILCAEFVSMSHAPPFAESAPPIGILPPPPDPRRLRAEAKRGFADEGFAGMAAVLRRALDALGEEPGGNCMTRHLLESALRAALLAPIHAARSMQLGVPSPERLSRYLITGHLRLLEGAIRLDALATPLQRRGIPIICQDVPPVPTDPDAPGFFALHPSPDADTGY